MPKPLFLTYILSVTFAFENFAQQNRAISKVEFDHLYIVVPDDAYNKIVSNSFIISEFCNVDKGRGEFLPIDTTKKEAYFRVEDAYFELLSDKNKWNEPVNKIGIGWVTNTPGVAGEIFKISKDLFGEKARSADQKNEKGDRDHTVIYTASTDTINNVLNYWIYDYDPAFINKIYNKKNDRKIVDITGKKDRLPFYSADKYAKNIQEISLTLTEEDLDQYLKWLSFLNYTIVNKEGKYIAENNENRFTMVPANESLLIFIKFSLNEEAVYQKITFSDKVYIEFDKDECVWWFN